VSIPRGFALVIGDADAHGWSRRTWSTPSNGATWLVVKRRHPVRGRVTLLAIWIDGAWEAGLIRHPLDPVAIGVGANRLRPILSGREPAPRWVRPDLNAPRPKSKTPRSDEGTPARERWSPDIERRVQAGMDRLANYGRTREWT